MKNNNINLDVIHPEKERVEYFLNNVKGKLESIPFHAGDLNHVDDIIAGFKFKEQGQPTFVIVIFATSYFHANKIQTANVVPGIKWTINGDILFGVE